MTLGERIAQLRKNKNMTQEDLAEELSVSRQTISSWENDGSLPSTDQFVKLAKCFDVSLDYLILNKEEEKNNKDENKEMKFHILNMVIFFIIGFMPLLNIIISYATYRAWIGLLVYVIFVGISILGFFLNSYHFKYSSSYTDSNRLRLGKDSIVMTFISFLSIGIYLPLPIMDVIYKAIGHVAISATVIPTFSNYLIGTLIGVIVVFIPIYFIDKKIKSDYKMTDNGLFKELIIENIFPFVSMVSIIVGFLFVTAMGSQYSDGFMTILGNILGGIFIFFVPMLTCFLINRHKNRCYKIPMILSIIPSLFFYVKSLNTSDNVSVIETSICLAISSLFVIYLLVIAIKNKNKNFYLLFGVSVLTLFATFLSAVGRNLENTFYITLIIAVVGIFAYMVVNLIVYAKNKRIEQKVIENN